MNRTQDWLEQARRDLDHARQSIGLEHFAWACFAAQQAAEKAVKALHLHLGTVAWGHSKGEGGNWKRDKGRRIPSSNLHPPISISLLRARRCGAGRHCGAGGD